MAYQSLMDLMNTDAMQQGQMRAQAQQGQLQQLQLGQAQEDMQRKAQLRDLLPQIMSSGDPQSMLAKLMQTGNPDAIAMAGQLAPVMNAMQKDNNITYEDFGGYKQGRDARGQLVGQPIQKTAAPKEMAQSDISRLIQERDSLPPGDPRRMLYENALTKSTTHQPPITVQNYPAPTSAIDPVTGKPVLVQFGNKGDYKVSPFAPSDHIKPPTGEENTSAGYLGRMQAAEKLVGGLAGGELTEGTAMAGAVPFAGDYIQRKAMTEQQQKYKQASDDWIRAKLRKESGAVIADSEMKREYQTYFPQPGDEPGTISQKAQARMQAEQQLRQSAGRAAPPEGEGQTQIKLSPSDMNFIAKRRKQGIPDGQIAQELQQQQNAPKQASGTTKDPYIIQDDAGYNAVPKGKLYRAPDGSTRMKK